MSNNHGDLPEQETLRRRLRAAMLLCDVSLQELASRIDKSEKLSARTLRKLTNAETDIRLRALRPIAEALGIPLDWFTTQRPVWAPFGGETTPAFEQRLDELQAQIEAVAQMLPPVEKEAAASSSRQGPKPRAPRGSRRSTQR